MKISINLQKGTVKKETPPADMIIGIDLGTTNSLVAFMKDGKPVAVRNETQNTSLIPSIIHFATDETVIVGETAKQKLIEKPERTIYSIKRLMGKNYQDIQKYTNFFSYQIIDDNTDSLVKIRIGDKFYTPIELSAMILRELKAMIEKHLGVTANKAVITVPAYFNDAQRQATRDAGKLAGLDVLRIVNEPTAASLAYGIGLNTDEQKTIAVYDLGGGTFDISILRLEAGVFEVLSTNGDTFLGGDDIDKRIMDYWLEQKNIELDKNLSLSTLRLLAEKAKKTFSTTDSFEEQGFSLDKNTFDQLIQPLILRTLESCQQALTDAKLQKKDIEEVILVGGSTRIKSLQAAVQSFFGTKPNTSIDPDQAVALGAAIQADILAGNNKDIVLLDITPLSLGIETVGGLMDTIIPRNSKVPMGAGRQYTTSIDGQTKLKVAVYQGERDLVADNRKLGEFTLNGIPPMPAGLPKIEIQFVLNADGILQVKAKELRSGVEQTVQMKSAYGVSEEEMAKMLMDSIQHAAVDMKVRSLIEARNEASMIVLAGDKFLTQNKDILTEDEKLQTIDLLELLKNSISKEDKDDILKKIQDLNDYTAPLAHRALDYTIKESMQGKKIQ